MCREARLGNQFVLACAVRARADRIPTEGSEQVEYKGLLSATEFSFELTQVWARPGAWGTQGQGQEVLEKLKFRAQSLGGQAHELPWAGDVDTCR